MTASWKKTFNTIWAGQTASVFTSDIVQYVLLWSLTARTGSPAVLSIASLAGFLPTALLSPVIGSFIDRHNRKAIMIASDASIAAVTGILSIAGAMDGLSVPLIIVTMFLRALGSAFHHPCLQAVTPLIVPYEELAKCSGKTMTFLSVSNLLSPAAAAFLFAEIPVHLIILIDLIGAAAGIFTILISKIPNLKNESHKNQHIIKSSIEGFNLLRKEKGLYILVLISALSSMAYVPCGSLFPLMCMGYFGGTSFHAGIAETAFSVGMLAGGAILGAWGGTRDKMKTIIPAHFLLGLTMLLSGVVSPKGFVLFVIFTLVSGFSAPFFSSLFTVIIQEKIPPEFLGRILGVTSSVMTLACPAGLLLAGALGEAYGVNSWFIIGGILVIFCGVLCVIIPSVRRLDSSCDRKD